MSKQAFNPYLPSWEYIPDGEPRVFDGRVYVYGSHDTFDGEAFCLGDYVCWSADVSDLADWRYEGVIYRAVSDPRNADGTGQLFAPDVAKGADGRYYLYYALSNNNVMSVAVCDTPSGEYVFYGYVKHADGGVLGIEQNPVRQFDPGVMVDVDGSVYLYSGFSPSDDEIFKKHNIKTEGSYFYELESDMLTIKRGPTVVLPNVHNSAGTGFEGHEFFEASSIRKVNGRYYLIYSSINGHELCYAVSDRPDSGFKYGGTIISNCDVPLNGGVMVNYAGNNHGSIIEIGGDWYVFYHRQTNLHHFSRQGCAEKIAILPDGTIPQVEMTSQGLNGKPLAAKGVYPSNMACNLSSADGAIFYPLQKMEAGAHPYFTQTKPDGNYNEGESVQYIANLQSGAWCGFKYFEFNGVEVSITVNVRGNGAGKLSVSTERGGEAAAEIEITPCADITAFTGKLTAKPGAHALFFVFEGTGGVDFFDFAIV